MLFKFYLGKKDVAEEEKNTLAYMEEVRTQSTLKGNAEKINLIQQKYTKSNVSLKVAQI